MMDFRKILERAEKVYPDWPVGDGGGVCSVIHEDGTRCSRKAILGTGSSTICYPHTVSCLEAIADRFQMNGWGSIGEREMLFWLACGPVEKPEEQMP